jgi:hypothetical protein
VSRQQAAATSGTDDFPTLSPDEIKQGKKMVKKLKALSKERQLTNEEKTQAKQMMAILNAQKSGNDTAAPPAVPVLTTKQYADGLRVMYEYKSKDAATLSAAESAQLEGMEKILGAQSAAVKASIPTLSNEQYAHGYGVLQALEAKAERSKPEEAQLIQMKMILNAQAPEVRAETENNAADAADMKRAEAAAKARIEAKANAKANADAECEAAEAAVAKETAASEAAAKMAAAETAEADAAAAAAAAAVEEAAAAAATDQAAADAAASAEAEAAEKDAVETAATEAAEAAAAAAEAAAAADAAATAEADAAAKREADAKGAAEASAAEAEAEAAAVAEAEIEATAEVEADAESTESTVAVGSEAGRLSTDKTAAALSAAEARIAEAHKRVSRSQRSHSESLDADERSSKTAAATNNSSSLSISPVSFTVAHISCASLPRNDRMSKSDPIVAVCRYC